MPDVSVFPTWANIAVFSVAAVVIWLSGTRLSAYADVIADRTGLGKAFIGLVLLAFATSLPEIATTATAALDNNPRLAVNNLLGGIAMQTAVLALADATFRQGPLTYFTPRPVLLLQGNTLVVLLALTLAAIAAGPMLMFWGVSVWSLVLFGSYLLSVYLLHQYEGKGRWKPVDPPNQADEGAAGAQGGHRTHRDNSTRSIVLRFVAASVVILAMGWLLTTVAEVLAEQTGLGQSFVGATLVAIATSLPEVSTTLAAVKLGALSMAVSNIFGSNAICVMLLAFSDGLYRQGSIFAAVDQSATFAAAVGIVVTTVYIIGLVERRNGMVWRLGFDSATVVGLYMASLVVMYVLR